MKTIKIIALALLTSFMFTGCEDNEKAPFAFGEPGENREGSFVTVEFDQAPAFNAADLPGSGISGLLQARSSNVASYTLTASRGSAGTTSEYAEIYTTDTFPATFDVSLEQIMNALGQTLDDVVAGDQFNFLATSVSTDGTVTSINTIDSDVASEPGQKQSYDFDAAVSCPFVLAEIEGTYSIVALGFAGFFGESLATPRTVVSGPGDDQFTIVEGEYPAQNSDPLIVTVNTDTGNVLSVNEDGVSFDGVAQGFPVNTYLLIDGSVFSCIGFIDLRMNFFPFNGNPHDFILQKN